MGGTGRRRVALLGAAVLLLAGAAASVLAGVLPTPLRIVGVVLGATGVVVVVLAERWLDQLAYSPPAVIQPAPVTGDVWNLPVQPPGFSARDAEISRLRELLGRGDGVAIVALHGMAAWARRAEAA